MAGVSNPVKTSFEIPKKKIPNDKDDEQVLGKKSKKRKAGSASGTNTGVSRDHPLHS